MSAAEWVVVLGGAAAIAWVNWYFFLAGRGFEVAQVGSGGVQEVTIAVQGGYAPAEVRVRAGVPVRIEFNRQETSSCSEEVVFPEQAIRKFLPAFETTTVDLGALEKGSYEFTCGMGMLRGKLIVEEGRGES